MSIKATQRGIVISGIAILITAGNYFRLTGTEMIRPIHVVTLLTCGAAIGIFIMCVALYFRNRQDK
jgi:hypothetical protein